MRKYLGTTTDNSHREVDMYSDDELFYAVYDEGTDIEYTTQERIDLVEADPDAYLYTPYVEFIKLLR